MPTVSDSWCQSIRRTTLKALLGLEQGQLGLPGSTNTSIPHTLALLIKATNGGRPNTADWRAQMYLKRAYFDAYVSARYVYEVEVCEAAVCERRLLTSAGFYWREREREV